MSGDPRRRAGVAVLALAAAAALLALWALLTGGFRVHVFGVPLSVRGEHRAAAVAGVLAIVGVLLADRGLLKTTNAIRALASGALRAARWAERHAPRLLLGLALAAAASVLSLGVQLGVRSAGGSDPAGYVSEAMLWRSGNLRASNAIAANAPWPDAEGTFAPLAYRPSSGHTLVPIVAPGLPLLMALATTLAGACGPFLVGPVCAAMFVLATWSLGARVAGHAVGAMAAIAVAASPTVLFMSMSAMSDVPGAAFWTASLALACRRGPAGALASGVAAGIAILVRPNLAPLALFPMLLAIRPAQGERWVAAVRSGAAFTAGCLPAVLLVAWVFDQLYGSPFQSGYGDAAGLFSLRHAGANVERYPRWLWHTQGPVPFLFLLAPLLLWRRRDPVRPAGWLLIGFIAATFGSYVFYEPFDAWWFLRFLLPAFAPMFVLAFGVVWWASARWRPSFRRAIAAFVAAAAVYHGASRTREFGIVHLAGGEQKYADAARFAADHLPPNAVVLSMQHSGSIRLYAGRPILRYDLLPPDTLDAALEYVRREGYTPYLLIEDWEADIFRERFARQEGVSLVGAVPLAATADGRVLIFRGEPARAPLPPALTIPPAAGCGLPAHN